MSYSLKYSMRARKEFNELLRLDPDRHRKLVKTLRYLSSDPRHPSLRSHEFRSLEGESDEKVWEAYVDLNWRVFWHYGHGKDTITVVAITAHP